MKTCSKCHNALPSEKFSKDRHKADGLSTICKSCKSAYRKSYYAENAERARKEANDWHHKNKEYANARSREYYEKNLDKFKAARKAKYWKDPESAKRYVKDYNRERARIDPVFRIRMRCRKRIWEAFAGKGYSKKTRTFNMIGCTPEELLRHLEGQFSDGMTRENYGEWHIDHIIPLASAETEEEVISLCHYSNLQPMWASDNLAKGARIDYCNHKASA